MRVMVHSLCARAAVSNISRSNSQGSVMAPALDIPVTMDDFPWRLRTVCKPKLSFQIDDASMMGRGLSRLIGRYIRLSLP